MLKFVQIKTLNRDGENERNVELSFNGRDVSLLGGLEHSTVIVVDQQLVDELQEIVNYQNYQWIVEVEYEGPSGHSIKSSSFETVEEALEEYEKLFPEVEGNLYAVCLTCYHIKGALWGSPHVKHWYRPVKQNFIVK